MIDADDITDSTFQGLSSTQKTAYLNQGALMFTAEATRAGIDEDLIADPLTYTPFRMMVVCTLISMCRDLIGSSFREVREGLVIDVYQMKLNELEKELSELRASFTPTMCGYAATGDDSGTGSISVTWGRA